MPVNTRVNVNTLNKKCRASEGGEKRKRGMMKPGKRGAERNWQGARVIMSCCQTLGGCTHCSGGRGQTDVEKKGCVSRVDHSHRLYSAPVQADVDSASRPPASASGRHIRCREPLELEGPQDETGNSNLSADQMKQK